MYNPPSSSTEAEKVTMPSSSSSSSCLGRAAVPVKRVWRGLTSRLGRSRRRRTTTYVPVNPHHDDDEGVNGVLAGLGRLRKEVRSCEYQDVHVMWEMLSSSTNGGGAGVFRGGSMDHDEVPAAPAGKVAAPKRRRARKHAAAAPVGRLVTYCCGAF